MPALPAVPNVIKVRAIGHVEGAPWNNVLHVHYSGVPEDGAGMNDFASLMATAFESSLLVPMAPASLLTGIEAVDLTSDTTPVGEWTGSAAGSTGSDPATAQVAACISWKISRRFRGGHPRTYLAGIPAGETVDNQHWATTYHTLLTTAAANWLSEVAAGTIGTLGVLRACAVSYVHGGSIRPAPLVDLFNSSAVDLRVDTMRRRLGRS